MPPQVTRENLNAGQTKSRRWRDIARPKDVFGRQYVVHIDRAAGDIVGLIERCFTAPIDIPDKYLRVPVDRRWRLEINFAGYITELKHARRAWELAVEQAMVELYGDKSEGAPTQKVLRRVGPPPQDWRLVALAARGDRWCLGLTAMPTPAATAIAPQLTAPKPRPVDDMPEDYRLGDPALEALAQQGAPVRSPRFADEEDDDAPAWLAELTSRTARGVVVDEEDEDEDAGILTGGAGDPIAAADPDADLAGLTGDARAAALDGDDDATVTSRPVPHSRQPDGRPRGGRGAPAPRRD